MQLTRGIRLGPYEILAAIGAGEWAKCIAPRTRNSTARSPLKSCLPRWRRVASGWPASSCEAKVLASLNHPNIAQVYGLEESGPTPALVMELVPGSTLSVTQLPLEAALHYARQIAGALEAHERGITHRDLKSANIMITPESVVKLLDFGLATLPAFETGGDFVNSVTRSMTATQAGTIMGTVAYLSPEQAAGKPVDKRSDISEGSPNFGPTGHLLQLLPKSPLPKVSDQRTEKWLHAWEQELLPVCYFHLASIPPFGVGFSTHRGYYPLGLLKSADVGLPRSRSSYLMRPTGLSLGTGASLQSPLPFHLAQPMWLA